jgi:hypothetical protein
MYNLHHRLWIAISVSTVAIGGFSCPLLANPQPKVISAQLVNKAPVRKGLSTSPVNPVLANIRANSPLSKGKGSANRLVVTKSSQVPQSGRHTTTDRSLEGIAHFTDTDRDTQKTNVSAVDRLIK